ncbi:MAG: DUF2817 domain-containing protein [Bacteriovoracaceae bacterium]|nr:DUF2817 domain-containing protein [Bacteriovoracaceae bacterium]
MKIMIFFYLFLSLNVFASTTTESVYVQDLRWLSIVSQYRELTVDHVSSRGFELYGPVGLKQWLKDNRVTYIDLEFFSQKLKMNSLQYPTYEQIAERLKQVQNHYPHLVSLKSIGRSNEGRELWVIKISDNVNVDEVEPEFKYISSMHGDEITGRELMLEFIDDLLRNYGQDSYVTSLINNTEIFIMPSMNPDGSFHQKRGNAHSIDLNRNFPDVRDPSSYKTTREIETQLVMAFQDSRNFVLSANFHGGAVVVNYPWDATYDRHPFDTLVQDLSLDYASLNPEMDSSTEFPRGIVNGADWYIVRGGMQDWSYAYYGDLQLTIELSEQKWPDYSMIAGYYQRNRSSLFKYAGLTHQGAGFKFTQRDASGYVELFRHDGNTLQPLGRYPYRRGEFYKVLEPGRYTMKVYNYQRTFYQEVVVEVKAETIAPNGNYISL